MSSLLEQYQAIEPSECTCAWCNRERRSFVLACQSMMDIAFCESEEWLQSKAVVEAAKKDGVIK